MAAALAARGRLVEAIRHFERSGNLAEWAKAHFNLGVPFGRAGG